MFNNIEELINYYGSLYLKIFSFINTYPKYGFNLLNKDVNKMYKLDYKELKKYQKKEKKVSLKYWYWKEHNNEKMVNYYFDKIKFLKDRRKKTIYKFKSDRDKLIERLDNMALKQELANMKQRLIEK